MAADDAKTASGASRDLPAEFQAIILAGGSGNRLYPLTEEMPKPLLPICNRPLLHYQLQLLERSGFEDVIVITNVSMQKAVQGTISSYAGNIKADLVAVDTYGTAEALTKCTDKIHTDFFVISGDVITDVFIHYLADIHRSRDASLSVLLKEETEEKRQKTAKQRRKDMDIRTQCIGLSPRFNRLLYFRAAADVEDGMRIEKSVLRAHPNMTMHTKLMDAHLYIFSRWVLDLLAAKPKISSIQGELIPYLVRLQFKAPQKWVDAATGTHQQTRSLQLSGADHSKKDPIQCFAYVAPPTSFCERANTVKSYASMNKQLASVAVGAHTPWAAVVDEQITEAVLKRCPGAKIGPQCVVAADIAMGPKSSAKRSSIGARCTIGNNVRIVNSIIMEDVVIGDRVTINNSIVCSRAKIEKGASIADAQIGAGYVAQPGASIKNEAVVNNKDEL